jgi:hypothetical protein
MPSPRYDARIVALLACGLALTSAAGCSHKTVHAAAPVTVPPAPVPAETERPMNVAPDTSALPPGSEPTVPPAVPPTASNPPQVMIPKNKLAPAPPRPTSGQTAAEVASDEGAHPVAPQIAPQLSASDQEIYKRKTDEDIGVAEQNLHQADGKQLSAAQKDLVEKISGFLAQSRDASKGGDWARAQNLAQKARLLSVELVNSL